MRLAPGWPARPIIAFGEYDIYGDIASRLIARYPGARVITLRNAGHVPWIQPPGAFQELLEML
jgi:proline iminopeptidase